MPPRRVGDSNLIEMGGASPGRIAMCQTRIVLVALAALVLASSGLALRADETADAREADWRTLAKLVVRYVGDFDSQGKFTRGGGAYMAAYRPWKEAYVPFWTQFRERYGTTLESVEKHFAGMDKPKGVPQPIAYLARHAFKIDVAKHEQRMAAWAAAYAQSQHKSWKRLYDQDHENVEVMMRQADRSAGFAKLAAKLDPGGDHAALIAQGEDAVAKTVPKYKAKLKDKAWPAHNPAYKGTDTADALAAATLAFLKAHPDWTAPEYDDVHVPVAAVVSGSAWTVYKAEPITGTPIQHSIKMLVAFVGEKDPDLAYCYFMELYTKDELGVEPQLPFAFANSRQFECYRMLRENLP